MQLFCFHSFTEQKLIASTPCPKISGTPVSNAPNSVCSSWISTKYRTLHYLDISYGHTHYDIRAYAQVASLCKKWNLQRKENGKKDKVESERKRNCNE